MTIDEKAFEVAYDRHSSMTFSDSNEASRELVRLYEQAKKPVMGEVASVGAKPLNDAQIRTSATSPANTAIVQKLVDVLKQSEEKLLIEAGGLREYKGGVPTQFLFPHITEALTKAEAWLERTKHEN